jgi:hypothetical protein
MGVGYREARDALAAADGNIVDALVMLEQQQPDIHGIGRAVAEKVSEVIVEKRQLSDVRVKLFDRTICTMPTALVGLAAVLVVVAGEVASHCSVEYRYGPDCESQGTADDVVTD